MKDKFELLRVGRNENNSLAVSQFELDGYIKRYIDLVPFGLCVSIWVAGTFFLLEAVAERVACVHVFVLHRIYDKVFGRIDRNLRKKIVFHYNLALL